MLVLKRITEVGPRKVVYQLRAFAALVQDLGMVSSTQIVTCNHPKHLFQETWYPLLASVGTRHICGTYTYMQAKDSHVYVYVYV